MKKISVIVGSLRKGSFNRKMAKALMALAPDSLSLEIIEIGKIPFYNQDLEDNPPQAWTEFREHLKEFDGVLFVTPEYNRSVPSVIKNALDVGSRPYAKNMWEGKPAGIVSVSIGAIGGFGANHHLRQALVCLDMPTMQQPEAYIGNAESLFDENGELASASVKQFATKYMLAFAAWVELTAPYKK
ncbi:MAG: NAD(P)H-dependent oxidoreductase [Desulfuromonadaceae bacterium]|nr:NAD(P)H-dependent oxidoreductase [Desulfuromonadaceae bacterium]